MSRKTAFQAMDISLNTFIIFAEIYYVLSKLMLCFYVLKNKAILSCLYCSVYRAWMYSRIHEQLLILYFENARGAAPSVLKEKNQQFRVYSTT